MDLISVIERLSEHEKIWSWKKICNVGEKKSLMQLFVSFLKTYTKENMSGLENLWLFQASWLIPAIQCLRGFFKT